MLWQIDRCWFKLCLQIEKRVFVDNMALDMLYEDVIEARFISRTNRFIALAQVEERQVVCHVKNTGRLNELLLPGARVILSRSRNPARKTLFDLVSVYKGDMLVNIDSQAPNMAALPFLQNRFPKATILREQRWEDSRLDFHAQSPDLSLYVEVKGCTLKKDGAALFPDAPTERGIKHLHSLISCVRKGHQGMVLFVIQMSNVLSFAPNDSTHAAFGEALRAAAQAGVQVLAYDCLVSKQGMSIHRPVEVVL